MGLSLWTEDETGAFQTIPYAGQSWQPATQPRRLAHQYIRNDTAKRLPLFHPATGQVRVKGVRSATHQVLHAWMKEQLSQSLERLPVPQEPISEMENEARWRSWQQGLLQPITLSSHLPRLRLLLVMDNLKGHRTPSFVVWLFAQGILPLSTPLGGSWLNRAESMQRIRKRRALDGQHPQTPDEIIGWLAAAARGWNANPTPFVWGGKRAARRQRSRERQHAAGGSCAFTRRPLRRSKTVLQQWQQALQMTH